MSILVNSIFAALGIAFGWWIWPEGVNDRPLAALTLSDLSLCFVALSTAVYAVKSSIQVIIEDWNE